MRLEELCHTAIQVPVSHAPLLKSVSPPELYSKANNKNGSSIAYYPWPNFDEKYLVETSIEMVVQVNGKVRDRLQVPAEIDNSKIEELAMNSENVKRHIEGKKVKKVIQSSCHFGSNN